MNLSERLKARPNTTYLEGMYKWEIDTNVGTLIFNNPKDGEFWVYSRFVDVDRAAEFWGMRHNNGFNPHSGKFNQFSEQEFIRQISKVINND